LLIGLFGARVADRARAARRYLVLAATFTVLLLLPIAALVVPPVAIAIRSVPIESAPPTFPAPGTEVPAGATVRPSSQVTPSHIAREAARGWTLPSLATALRMVWAIGFALCLMPVAFTLWRLRVLRRSAVRWAEGEARARRRAAEAGVHRKVMVLRHARVAAPMTDGLFTPVILLPVDVSDWSDADLERALVHELEHVRRMDWPAHLLARTTCAIYWFHPLVWRAWCHLHLDADRACDDAVVERGEGRAFAEQLVALAQRISAGRTRPILAMAGRGDLSRRVVAVLDARQARGRAGARWSAAAAALALAAVAVVSPLSAVEDARSAAAGIDRRLDVERPVATRVETAVPIPPRAARAEQAAAAQPPERFESVSIRRTTHSGASRTLTARSGGVAAGSDSLIAYDISLDVLVRWAYGIPNPPPPMPFPQPPPRATLEGLPYWIERFDVRAKSPRLVSDPPAGTLGPMHLMTQAMLADRFKLTAHWESRPRPAYALTRADGGNGPQLRETTEDCATRRASQPPATFDAPIPHVPNCGLTGGPGREGTTVLPATHHVRIGTRPLRDLVDWLEATLGRQVIDRTGLAGNFDLELRYTRYAAGNTASGASPGVPKLPPLADVPFSPEWPVLAVALRDQLGLQLTTETVEDRALVVDRVEQPAED
jgi:uncharacterized protein (TIGR03435 family)